MEKIFYGADMSDGSKRLIGTMEDVKNFLKASAKQEKGLIITKYSVINPAFVVSISRDYTSTWTGKEPEPVFLNGLSDNKLLN